MEALQALRRLKRIKLTHTEKVENEGYNGEVFTSYYEEQDGKLGKVYKKECACIEKELNLFKLIKEELIKGHVVCYDAKEGVIHILRRKEK